MKITKKGAMQFGIMAIGLLAALHPDTAWAVKDAGTAAKNIESNIVFMKSLALSIFSLAGVVLVGMGLFLFYKENKQPNQGHAKNGFVAVIIGSCLLSVSVIIGMVSGTWGANSKDVVDNIEKDKGF
ncbi:DUF6750 family protein [Vibrio splendidus]|nr:DUF6750 family protein [Vibrio splendidus]MCC4880698.1 hypothetical protein [Vibrio splendidus]